MSQQTTSPHDEGGKDQRSDDVSYTSMSDPPPPPQTKTENGVIKDDGDEGAVKEGKESPRGETLLKTAPPATVAESATPHREEPSLNRQSDNVTLPSSERFSEGNNSGLNQNHEFQASKRGSGYASSGKSSIPAISPITATAALDLTASYTSSSPSPSIPSSSLAPSSSSSRCEPAREIHQTHLDRLDDKTKKRLEVEGDDVSVSVSSDFVSPVKTAFNQRDGVRSHSSGSVAGSDVARNREFMRQHRGDEHGKSVPSTLSLPSRKFRFLRTLPVFFLLFLICFLSDVFIMYHCIPLMQLHIQPQERDHSAYIRGLAETVVFSVLFCLFLISYGLAVSTHPGSIPNTPEWDLLQNEDEINYNLPQVHETKGTGKPRQCKWCRKLKPDRAHHCRVCRSCVLKMDHHCPWIYNCVGWGNQKYFILCLIYGCATSIFVGAAMFESVIKAVNAKETPFDKMFLVLFAETMNGFLALLVSVFLIFHLGLVRNGMTTIEFCEKKFKWKNSVEGSAWSRGCRKNFAFVFGSNPFLWLLPIDNREGDGIIFERQEGAAQLLDTKNYSESSEGLNHFSSRSPQSLPLCPKRHRIRGSGTNRRKVFDPIVEDDALLLPHGQMESLVDNK